MLQSLLGVLVRAIYLYYDYDPTITELGAVPNLSVQISECPPEDGTLH